MNYSKLEVTKYEGKVGFDPFVISGLFDDDILKLMRMQLKELKKDLNFIEHDQEIFHRNQIHNHPLMTAVHEILRPKVESILKRPLKNSYNYLSIYEPGKGECPRHTDRPQCRYTVDLCIDQKEPWAFGAKNESDGVEKEFKINRGESIVLSGTHHEHWRPATLPSDNFCDLVFFHFVDPDYEGDLN